MNETDYNYPYAHNVLQLGTGITATQLTITSDSSGNIYLADGTAGDRIKLDGELSGFYQGVQSVQFADGSMLARQQIATLATTGTTGANNLYGTSAADTFDGKGAPAGSQDYEHGGGGKDIFIYNQGYGQLEVDETDYQSSDTNVLRLGAGITTAQITITSDSSGNIYLADGTAGDRIKLDGELNGSSYGVQSVQFADGTSLSKDQLIASSRDPGPTAAPGSLTVGHGKAASLTSLVQSLVTPGRTGDTETVTAVSAKNGQASLNAGTGAISYIAPTSGGDTVTYTVADQLGDTAKSMISVTVDPGPTLTGSAPSKVGYSQTVAVGTVAPGLIGDALSLVVSAVPASGTLGLDAGGTVHYAAPGSVPAGGTTAAFSYQIQDQYGDLSPALSQTIQLDPGPTATSGTLTVGHDQTLDETSFVAGLVKPGLAGDTETITAVTGRASLSGGRVAYATPASGSDSFTYTVTDQLGDTATDTVSVTVDPGPTAASGTLVIGHNKTQDLSGLVKGLITPGLAGDSETVTAASANAGTATFGAGGAVSYAAPASGADTVTYAVADQLGDTTTGTVAVTIDPGPVLTPAMVAKVGHGQAVQVGAVAPGLAGDTLALTTTNAGRGALSLAGGVLTYTAPAAGGTDAISYTVTDQLGDVVTGAFSTVVDAGPTAAIGSLTVGYGKAASLTSLVNGLVAPGLAGDTETVTAVSATKGQASLNTGTGAISYIAPASGSDTVTYTVADQLGDAATGTVGVRVDPGPTAGTLSRTAPLGSSVNLTSAILGVATPGLQGDTLAITADGTTGTLGTVSLVSGQLTYAASGSGLQDIPQGGTVSDSFAYTASDQYGDAASGTVNLTVTNPTPKLLTLTSGGSLQDAAGNTWTLATNGDFDENGTSVPGGTGTAQFTIANDVEYGLDAQGSGWYAYSPTTQSWASSAPPPGLYPPPTQRGVTTDSGGSLKDAAGNIWTLTANGDVNENGTPVPGGSSTAEFTIVNNVDYGLDSGGTGWYTYAPATQAWTNSAAPTITIPQSTTSATISLSSALVNATAGNHAMFISGSSNTLTLTGGTETITDLGGTNTYVIPAAGKGYDTFTTDVFNLNDVLDLRPALKATNWTGTASTLSKYLSVVDSSQGAALSISATSGGAKAAIALIGGANTTNLSTLLTHAITR